MWNFITVTVTFKINSAMTCAHVSSSIRYTGWPQMIDIFLIYYIKVSVRAVQFYLLSFRTQTAKVTLP
jgi:hypothetical protein